MSIYLNGKLIEFKTYPNGEVIVPILEQPRGTMSVEVRLHWTSDEDFLHLALVRGVTQQWTIPVLSGFFGVNLVIDYLPYSRMDREQDGHCFSLKYAANLINAMNFSNVYVVEPHSLVTLELLNRSEPIWATARMTPIAMAMMNFDKEHDYLVLPDGGAYKRYFELIPELQQCHVVVLRKAREFSTGKITGLEIDRRIHPGSSTPISGSQALILDDLSSRGGTFIAAAETLRKLNIHHVSLLVTHMEPAGLLGDLRHKLNRVFCTDTMEMPRPLPSNFELIPRSHWL